MGGSSGTQAGGPAPIAQQTFDNTAFGQAPWANTGGQAQGAAYSGIQGLNTNPQAQYGNAQATGQNLTSQGSQLAGQGGQLAGQALDAWQAGQDPQNALYAQQYQQNQDQANATNAQNGVAGTPYGASLTNQSDQNFNLNWQQQQLARQQTAAGTASTLLGAGGSGLTAGANAATSGLGLGQSVDTQQANAQQNQIQDYLSYLLGNTSNSSALTGAQNTTYGNSVNAANVTNTGAQQSNAANAASLQGLGSLAGSAAKLLLL